MNETWQMVIVILLVALSVGWATWRFVRLLRKRQDPCCGCEGCCTKQQKEKKLPCCKQK